MIQLTKLNNAPIVVNSDQIEFIEETPDTVITLMNNDKVVVRDRMSEIIEKIIHFRRMIRGIGRLEGEKPLHCV